MCARSAPRSNPLWTAAGFVSLAIGIVGIVLPLVPTTSLVLLAAFCFGKGSPRMQAWIVNHARFGPMIADWRARGAIARPAKRMAVLAMTATLVLSVALGVPPLALAIQAVCLAGVAVFILTRPDA